MIMWLAKRFTTFRPRIKWVYVWFVINVVNAPDALGHPQHYAKAQISDVRVRVHFKINIGALSVYLDRHDEAMFAPVTNFVPIWISCEHLRR